MGQITLDVNAGDLSSELIRLGIKPESRVRATVDVEEDAGDLDLAAILMAGGAFDWLADEPDLYTEADVTPPDPQAG